MSTCNTYRTMALRSVRCGLQVLYGVAQAPPRSVLVLFFALNNEHHDLFLFPPKNDVHEGTADPVRKAVRLDSSTLSVT